MGKSVPSKIVNFTDVNPITQAIQDYKLEAQQAQETNITTAITQANVNSGGANMGSPTSQNGKATYCEKITINSNRSLEVQLIIYNNTIAVPYGIVRVHVIKDVEYTLPLGLCFPFGFGIAVSARKWLDTDTTDATTVVTYWNKYITDDIYEASTPIIWLGDSILNGTGPTSTYTMYNFMTRTYLRRKQVDCKNIVRAYSGYTTGAHLPIMDNGKYQMGAKIAWIALGVNDAAQSVPIDTYEANMRTIIELLACEPSIKLIVCNTPTPMQNATSWANVQAIKTRLTNIVANYGSGIVSNGVTKKILMCDVTTAFPNTTESYYVASDTSGNKIHPNDTGHAAIYNTIKTFIDSNLSSFQGL